MVDFIVEPFILLANRGKDVDYQQPVWRNGRHTGLKIWPGFLTSLETPGLTGTCAFLEVGRSDQFGPFWPPFLTRGIQKGIQRIPFGFGGLFHDYNHNLANEFMHGVHHGRRYGSMGTGRNWNSHRSFGGNPCQNGKTPQCQSTIWIRFQRPTPSASHCPHVALQKASWIL
jgi:hypothetical protein